MLKAFRIFIFVFGLFILFLAKTFIHGDTPLNSAEVFIWTSIVVMYFLVFSPFTFFKILPKNETFDKMIAVYTASWMAISSYCGASLILLGIVIKRDIISRLIYDLPADWQTNSALQGSELVQKATSCNETIFHVIVVLQLILFFVLMIKIYLGCVVSKKIGQVEQRETQEFSAIKSLRMETQLLAQECTRNAFINQDLRRKIERARDDMRYLSPVNSAEGVQYETQMLDVVKSLRVLCKQGNDVSREVEQALENLKALTQARKLIYKN